MAIMFSHRQASGYEKVKPKFDFSFNQTKAIPLDKFDKVPHNNEI